MMTQYGRLFSFCLAAIVLVCALGVGVSAQNPTSRHPVTEFGAFIPDKADPATIDQNNATINNAIVQVGKAGGGIIELPVGTYYIGPDPNKTGQAVTIGYDNITLRGAGVGRTILKTNGTWDTAHRRRGHGIVIVGTHTQDKPRKNIVLRDFELDGQAGWTGEYNWPADPATGKGWDIEHKGIVASWDAYCDNILLENLYVHHYRGEILYVGGMLIGKLTVRNVKMANTNGSDFNLYAADLLVEHCEFAGPSRFWAELGARPNQAGYAKNQMVFRNNKFWNVRDRKIAAGQIAITQGDFKPYAITFDHNDFRDCPDVFGFYGGIAGPIAITNNTATNCRKFVVFGYSGGWVNSNENANITVANNRIYGGRALIELSGIPSKNVMVRDNTFTGKAATDPGASTAVAVTDGAHTNNVTIKKNTFKDCRTPEQGTGLTGTRPLFIDNTYQHTETRDGQGFFTITTASQLVTPSFEMVRIMTDTDGTVVELATDQYQDGQVITITGGSAAKRVRFAAGQASYSVAQDRYLDGKTTLRFRYDGGQKKWVEVAGQ